MGEFCAGCGKPRSASASAPSAARLMVHLATRPAVGTPNAASGWQEPSQSPDGRHLNVALNDERVIAKVDLDDRVRPV